MELRPGYKLTEVGAIPEDWEAVTVQKLVEETILEKPLDGNHGSIHPKSSDYVDHGIPFVMANNIMNGQIDLLNCKFITKARADKLQKGFSISGDVLLTHKGTVGNTAIVGELSTDYIILTPQVTYYRVINANRLNNCFLRHYFDTQPFQSLFSSLAGGGTRAYLGIIKQLALPVIKPPIEEQRAIAEVLSDADGLLGGLDRLIAKKRDLKQAAMQQLLTRHTRLPGFHGEWVMKPIAQLEKQNLVRLSRGNVISKKDIEAIHGEYPIYSSSVHNNGMFGRYGKFMFDEELITWSIDGGGNFFHRHKHKFSVTNVCGFMRVDTSRINYQFFAAQLQLLHSRKSFDYQSKAHPSVIRKEYEVQIPPLPEQTAIAAVLSDMDAELATLEQRREKTRALKQAMMQELLTGKTRLVAEGEPHARTTSP